MTNRHVNAIAGRLSLRPPQRRSLELLDRVTEIAPPKKGANVAAALEAIRREARWQFLALRAHSAHRDCGKYDAERALVQRYGV